MKSLKGTSEGKLTFEIEKKLAHTKARAGKISTPHGDILTPAFVVVGTKGTVKSLSPEQVKDLGAQVTLANTYHLYLQPGSDAVDRQGSLSKFMNWNGPTMTDSGGFQVFSLGAAYGKGASKIGDRNNTVATQELVPEESERSDEPGSPLAKIDEDGVTFKSVIDGSTHRFTPEISMKIQHEIGADIFFAFDECTSPHAPYEYQKEAIERTHRWAKRSLDYHKAHNTKNQALFGVVQGGRFEDLRKESARAIAAMDFDGFGIGGSFDKEDIYTAVGWVNEILPENKPRHLLGIGDPADLFGGVENGVDTFDCVAPTRIARNGNLYTQDGRISITNSQYRTDLGKIDADCGCYTCTHYTRAYLAHLFHAKEMFAATLASIHNLYFIVHLVEKIRQSVIDGTFFDFKKKFLERYY